MRIMFVGDINLGEYYTSFGHGPGSYLKHSDVFENVRDLFSQADFVVGNLETPLTTHNFNPTEPESVVLRGDPKHAVTLSDAGFRVLQVANNHTVQHGKEGFRETVESLSSAGVKSVGLNEQTIQTLEIGGKLQGFLQHLTSRTIPIKHKVATNAWTMHLSRVPPKPLQRLTTYSCCFIGAWNRTPHPWHIRKS